MIYILLFELLLYFLCSYIILKNIYGYIPKNNKLVYITPLLYLPFIIIDLTVEQDMINFILIVAVLLNILYLKYIFKTSKIRSIICIFVILYSINIAASSITIFIFNESDNLILKEFTGLFIDSLFMISCMIICKTKQSYIQSRFQLIPSSVKRITLLSLIASAFVISLVSDYGGVKDIDKWGFSIRITLVILVIVVGSAFPIMIANSIGKSFYTEQSKSFQQQIQTQAKYYKVLSKSNYELRRFKHDYNNMRIGVTKYIQNGSFEEAEQMLNNCDSLLTLATKSLIKFDTGNGIVDAILTEKQEKATTVNTVITFDGAVASSEIAATDLCVIFGNTLDNAIEACEKLQTDEGKTISVICKCSGGFIFLTITNPIDENVEIHNNSIQTSKQDKSNHGFGIYSIQKIVDKYNGELTLSCENYLFKTEIVLNI